MKAAVHCLALAVLTGSEGLSQGRPGEQRKRKEKKTRLARFSFPSALSALLPAPLGLWAELWLSPGSGSLLALSLAWLGFWLLLALSWLSFWLFHSPGSGFGSFKTRLFLKEPK